MSIIMRMGILLLVFGCVIACVTWWIADPIAAVVVALAAASSVLWGLIAIIYAYIEDMMDET